MGDSPVTDPAPNQLTKFKEAPRQLETDDDPERFKESWAGW